MISQSEDFIRLLLLPMAYGFGGRQICVTWVFPQSFHSLVLLNTYKLIYPAHVAAISILSCGKIMRYIAGGQIKIINSDFKTQASTLSLNL